MGNRLLTFLSNLFTDLNLTDMETCYKVFRTDVLQAAAPGLQPLRHRARDHRQGRAPGRAASTRCRSATTAASTGKARRSAGRTASSPSGRSSATPWSTIASDADRRLDRHAPAAYQSPRYSEWLWTPLAPAVGDRVLEIGSGNGSFTRYLRNHALVVATEQRRRNASSCCAPASASTTTSASSPIDWTRRDLDALRGERFDTVLCLNVLEHLEHDDDALAAIASLLPAGGRLIVQVPAHARSLRRDRPRHRPCPPLRTRRARRQLRRHGFAIETRALHQPARHAWSGTSTRASSAAAPSPPCRPASPAPWSRWLRLEDRFELRGGCRCWRWRARSVKRET